MSGETILVYGTAKTLESNGTSISNGAVTQASVATYDLVSDGGGYPDALFALVGAFAVAPAEGAVLALYARPMAIDGANNSEVPESTRPTMLIGTFVVNNVTTSQAMLLNAYDLPKNAQYFIHNNGTGQSLSAGWTLKVTPRTYKAAP